MKKRVVKFKKETEKALIKAVSKKKLKGVKLYIIVGNSLVLKERIQSLFVDSTEDITVVTQSHANQGVNFSDGIGFLYGVTIKSEAEWIQIQGRFNRIGSKYPNQILKVFIKDKNTFMRN